jgi:HK97 family phage major capsid protein
MSLKETLKTRRTELATLSNQGKTLYDDLEKAGANAKAEDRVTLSNLIETGKAKRVEVENLEALVANDEAANGGEVKSRTGEQPEQRSYAPAAKSWGQQVIESPQYKTNNGSTMDRVQVKNLLTGVIGSAGAFAIQPVRLPDVNSLPQRPVSVLDYINMSATSSNAVEYLEQGTRVNNAANIAEAPTVAGATTKPESDLTFTLKTAGVKTIATWIPVTRQILEDEPRMRAMIDGELLYQLRDRLEAQIISGDGTGANFLGLLNAVGIQSRVHQVSGARFTATDTVADTIRRSFTDLQMSFYDADVVLTHPATAEKLELEKDTTGQYIRAFDPVAFTLWRKPIVATMAVPLGTAVVMQGKLAATLWDRNQSEIRVGEPNAYFLQNLLAILAEMRAAFGVTRPLAIEKVTGL